MHHFFCDNQVLADLDDEVFALRLSSDDVHHARVLRLRPGEHIALVDAGNDYFECEVVAFDDDLMVRICMREGADDARPHVLLVQGIGKGDKMDTVVRHATELGVRAFVPLISDRTDVKLDERKRASREQRWRKIAKSAAMQSGQRTIPEIAPCSTVQEAARAVAGATCVLVCWEQASALGIGKAIEAALNETLMPAADARVAVVVGPEGGLAQHEVDAFLGSCEQARAVTLGPSILRTETAGIVASALAIYELGGLQ